MRAAQQRSLAGEIAQFLAVRARRGVHAPLAFLIVKLLSTARLYGRAGRLAPQKWRFLDPGSWPGQYSKQPHLLDAFVTGGSGAAVRAPPAPQAHVSISQQRMLCVVPWAPRPTRCVDCALFCSVLPRGCRMTPAAASGAGLAKAEACAGWRYCNSDMVAMALHDTALANVTALQPRGVHPPKQELWVSGSLSLEASIY